MNNIHGTERLCQAAFKLASHFDPNLAATIIRGRSFNLRRSESHNGGLHMRN